MSAFGHHLCKTICGVMRLSLHIDMCFAVDCAVCVCVCVWRPRVCMCSVCVIGYVYARRCVWQRSIHQGNSKGTGDVNNKGKAYAQAPQYSAQLPRSEMRVVIRQLNAPLPHTFTPIRTLHAHAHAHPHIHTHPQALEHVRRCKLLNKVRGNDADSE